MEKFFLKIDAESSDGESVKCESQLRASCSKQMAAATIANLIKQDDKFKAIILEAIMICASGKDFAENITSEEYFDKPDDEETNKDLDL